MCTLLPFVCLPRNRSQSITCIWHISQILHITVDAIIFASPFACPSISHRVVCARRLSWSLWLGCLYIFPSAIIPASHHHWWNGRAHRACIPKTLIFPPFWPFRCPKEGLITSASFACTYPSLWLHGTEKINPSLGSGIGVSRMGCKAWWVT